MTIRLVQVIILFFSTSPLFSLFAQENWMIQWQGIQQGFVNPAYCSDKSWEFSVASVGVDFQLGNLNAGNFINKNNSGVNVISLDKLASSLNEESGLVATGQFNTLDITHKMGAFTISAGHGINYEFSTMLNPTLIDILAHGNAAYVGKTVELGMPLNTSVYHKFYLGAAVKMGPLQVGARAAYLNGWHHLHTEKLSSQLTTGADYFELTFANDIEIYNAGIIDYNAIDDIDVIKGINNYRSLFTANHGLAFDLGAELKLTKNSGIFANVQNVGYIKWVDRAQKLTNTATTTLKGVNIEKIIDGEEDSSIEDSLFNAFDLTEENLEFSSNIAGRFNTGAYFTLGSTRLSAVFNFTSLAGIEKPSLFLQASRPIFSWLDLGVNYQWREDAAFNLGMMAKLKLGPVSIFGAFNNAYSLLKPSRLDGLSGRAGLTVGF